MIETPDGLLLDDAAAQFVHGDTDPQTVHLAQWALLVAASWCAIPCIVLCAQRRWYYELCVMAGAWFCAMPHRSLELEPISLPPLLLMLDEGRWHRLENVFLLLVCAAVMVRTADLRCPQRVELLQTVVTVVVVAAQEHAPWDFLPGTVAPLLLVFAVCAAAALLDARSAPAARAGMSKRGAVCVVAAGFFFVRGYDKLHDWMRASHALAMVFGWAGAYFLMANTGRGAT